MSTGEVVYFKVKNKMKRDFNKSPVICFFLQRAQGC